MSLRDRLLLVGLLSISMFFSGCLDPCENKMLAETRSPGSGKRAVVFERSCGATTGFSTQVSILDVRESAPKRGGNVFTVDSNHGQVTDMTVTVRWIAPDRIVIRYPARSRVFRKDTQANGVAVGYEIVP